MAVSSLDRLRIALSRWLFSPLQGTTLGLWRRALADNGWRVGLRFWPRAALTTVSVAANSLSARRERRLHRSEWEGLSIREPLFVLGHYRSGTTHLHNLLAADGRFAYPDNYQANFPHTFLTTEATGKRLGAFFTMRKRPHDNVPLDLEVPTEDELALCAATLLSPHMDWHFPARRPFYTDRYMDFRSATPTERRRWLEALQTFAAKLTLRHGRRLVFKSPLHTARIPLILAAFPDARFVTVHRDPYEVFRSTRRMELKVEPLFRYQSRDARELEDRILERYRRMYERYFEDREQLPADRLTEIGYAELSERPLETLERLYATLDLPDFSVARPRIAAYLESIAGYRKNVYPPLERGIRSRIDREWRQSFDAWGYATGER